MTGTLEAHTDVASDIVMYKYAREEDTDVPAKNTSNYLAGLPVASTQQEQCCHHPHVRCGPTQSGAKQHPDALDFLKYLWFVEVLGLQNWCCLN